MLVRNFAAEFIRWSPAGVLLDVTYLSQNIFMDSVMKYTLGVYFYGQFDGDGENLL